MRVRNKYKPVMTLQELYLIFYEEDIPFEVIDNPSPKLQDYLFVRVYDGKELKTVRVYILEKDILVLRDAYMFDIVGIFTTVRDMVRWISGGHEFYMQLETSIKMNKKKDNLKRSFDDKKRRQYK